MLLSFQCASLKPHRFCLQLQIECWLTTLFKKTWWISSNWPAIYFSLVFSTPFSLFFSLSFPAFFQAYTRCIAFSFCFKPFLQTLLIGSLVMAQNYHYHFHQTLQNTWCRRSLFSYLLIWWFLPWLYIRIIRSLVFFLFLF